MSRGPARPFWRWALLAAAALLLVAAAGWFYGRHVAPPPVDRTPSGGGPRSFAAAIGRADAVLIGAAWLARDHPREWLFQERLANAHIARARLTGDFSDYAAAQNALARAFAIAAPGAGPHQAQLALAMAMHRLGQAEAMTAAIDHYAVRPEIEDLIELRLVRGDIAFYRGDVVGALARYRAAGAEPNDSRLALRLAELDARTGKGDEALALIDAVERGARLPNAQFLADLALRRGAIALRAGDRATAARQFDRAMRLFPGWWLAEAHRAQVDALDGRIVEATAAFERIARRSNSPEAMDALASLRRAAGDPVERERPSHHRSAVHGDLRAAEPTSNAGCSVQNESAPTVTPP